MAIAEWGASQSEAVKHTLGFHNGITPHQSTIHRLFRRLNEEEVEAAFRWFFRHHMNSGQPERGATAVSIDGKAQRGRLKFEAEGTYPMHAVSIVDHQTGIVLTQGHVEPITPHPKAVLATTDLPSKKAQTQGGPPSKSPPRTKKTKSQQAEEQKEKKKKSQEEQKMKSELAVAALLIKQIDWNGKVLTGDALYCQRCLCHALRLAGGDYLFLVKGNQPQLLADIRLLFAALEPAKRAGEGLLQLPEQHGSRQRRSAMGA